MGKRTWDPKEDTWQTLVVVFVVPYCVDRNKRLRMSQQLRVLSSSKLLGSSARNRYELRSTLQILNGTTTHLLHSGMEFMTVVLHYQQSYILLYILLYNRHRHLPVLFVYTYLGRKNKTK